MCVSEREGERESMEGEPSSEAASDQTNHTHTHTCGAVVYFEELYAVEKKSHTMVTRWPACERRCAVHFTPRTIKGSQHKTEGEARGRMNKKRGNPTDHEKHGRTQTDPEPTRTRGGGQPRQQADGENSDGARTALPNSTRRHKPTHRLAEQRLGAGKPQDAHTTLTPYSHTTQHCSNSTLHFTAT